MKIAIRNCEGGIKVVDCNGRLTAEEGRLELCEVIVRLSTSGWTKIILNLREVTHLDGAALGELVNCWKKAQALGTEIRLLNLSARLFHLLEITKVSTLFGGYYSDEREAMASFRSRPEAEPLSRVYWSAFSAQARISKEALLNFPALCND
jgi:anti-anti-sigma factor